MADEQVVLRTMSNLTALEYEDGSHVLRVSAAGSAAGGQPTTLRTLYNLRAIQHEDGSHTPVVSVEGGEDGPVYSVNGESGNVSLTAAKIGAATAAQGETADAASAAVASEADARRALIDQVGSGDLVVTNEAGMGIARIHAGGAELPGLAVEASGAGTGLSVINDAGFAIDDIISQVEQSALTVNDMLAPPLPTILRPERQITSVGGFLRARDHAQPVTPSPYIKRPPRIVTATPGNPYASRTIMLIPHIAYVPRQDGSLGRIFIAYFASTTTDDILHNPYGERPGTYQVISYSDDGGITWADAYYLIPNPDEPLSREADAALLAWRGRLYIRYIHNSGLYGELGASDGFDAAWGGWLENPLADPKQFIHSPHTYTGIGFAYSPFIWEGQPHWPRACGAGAFTPASSLEGEVGRFIDKFWVDENVFEPVLRLPIESGAVSYPEHHVVQKRLGGDLLAYWRTSGGQLESTYSRATGQWSTPTSLVPKLGPLTASRIWLGRSPSGRLVLVYNASTNRVNMTLALSDDDGETWPAAMRVTLNAGSSTYPAADFGPDGEIYVTHDRRYANPTQIVFHRVIEQSVVAGSPSVTTVVVDTSTYTAP
ncbi:hypothetical protein FHS82_001083 [Pseudochelatococcus lubricantis]|uniref:Sialidase domain-containing protein n=1 Tax=Pseudochelatococcus lubricantis TaxID=1538102 RepID=A0ABX0UWB7_9HYPH|nr:sialidase family protein [Pseudochelatococcus lubricantis]NIJ57257.1 hypothetical protein [Pseudochelatococcus lubricantis]